MKAVVTMLQRTSIQRFASTSDQGGGYTNVWNDLADDIPCRGYPIRIRSAGAPALGGAVEASQTRPGVYEFTGVMIPKTQDIKEGDRLGDITDRLGNVVFTGPMLVDSVGELVDHKRLTVRRVE